MATVSNGSNPVRAGNGAGRLTRPATTSRSVRSTRPWRPQDRMNSPTAGEHRHEPSPHLVRSARAGLGALRHPREPPQEHSRRHRLETASTVSPSKATDAEIASTVSSRVALREPMTPARGVLGFFERQRPSVIAGLYRGKALILPLERCDPGRKLLLQDARAPGVEGQTSHGRH